MARSNKEADAYAVEQSRRLAVVGLVPCACGDDLAGECKKCEALLTADTITDEQIRELRKEQISKWREWSNRDARDCSSPPFEPSDLDHSFVALKEHKDGGRPGLFGANYITRAEARARCAEILNARKKES